MGLRDDFRQAWRALRRRPGFVALAGATLALGIGVNTALFSVLNAVVLQPLPYREPERLFLIRTASRSAGGLSGVSVPDFEDVRALGGPVETATLSCYWTFNLTGRDVPERLVGARVSGAFFDALGVRPLLGRALGPADDRAGAPEAVVLAQGVWHRTFGADPSVVGRSILLNGVNATVVGVMPASFRLPGEDVELWAAMSNNMTGMPRDSRFLTGLVRLRPGSAAAAEAAIGTYGVLSHSVRQRTSEIGVRMALGAGLRDVAKLVLAGALAPAAIGLALGLRAAALLARAIESQLFGVRASDPLTYVAVAALLLGSATLAAAIPARRAVRIDPAVALREG
jgi:hypothetical protein